MEGIQPTVRTVALTDEQAARRPHIPPEGGFIQNLFHRMGKLGRLMCVHEQAGLRRDADEREARLAHAVDHHLLEEHRVRAQPHP